MSTGGNYTRGSNKAWECLFEMIGLSACHLKKKKKSHNHLESRDGLDYVFCFLMKQFLAWGSCHVEIIHKAHNISLIIVLQQDNLKMD